MYIDESIQRETLALIVASGSVRDCWLQTIWESDDLAVMGDALRMFPKMPVWWCDRFESAIKQMSG